MPDKAEVEKFIECQWFVWTTLAGLHPEEAEKKVTAELIKRWPDLKD